MDVAAQIDPTSVHVTSLTEPGGLRILEQNYEYDLLSSETLMEKYVGSKVRLYQGNGTYQDATLLSTSGPVYEIHGQIHMGHQGQVVLPGAPRQPRVQADAPLAARATRRRPRSGSRRRISPAASRGRPTTCMVLDAADDARAISRDG